jgi:soluble lytic murein transglycosylase-like protein
MAAKCGTRSGPPSPTRGGLLSRLIAKISGMASKPLKSRWVQAGLTSITLIAGSLVASVTTSAQTSAQGSRRPASALTAAPLQQEADQLTPAQLCEGARKGNLDQTYALAWLYTSGKGVEQNDAYAAYLFFAASSAGHAGAKRMLNNMTWPAAELPKCMDESVENKYLPAGAAVAVNAPADIAAIVTRLAPRYGLDPKLVLAVISAESNFDKFALSPKEAMGLMQLIPKTADRFKVDKPFDPTQNIMGGMAYLRWLLAYFEGDLVLVTAAYNAGEHAVDKHLGVPPFLETQDYVRKVLSRAGIVQHPFDAKFSKPSASLKLMNRSAKNDGASAGQTTKVAATSPSPSPNAELPASTATPSDGDGRGQGQGPAPQTP